MHVSGVLDWNHTENGICMNELSYYQHTIQDVIPQ
jgi:hypothetical protein